MVSLPSREVVGCDPIIRIAPTLLDDIEDHRRSEEAKERNLVDRLMSGRKVNRRIEMRFPMLGGEEVVGGVVIAG